MIRFSIILIGLLCFPTVAMAEQAMPIVMSGPPAQSSQWGRLHKDGVTLLRYRPDVKFLENGKLPQYHKAVFEMSPYQSFADEAHRQGFGVWVLMQNLAYSTTSAQLAQTRALCSTFTSRDFVHGADEPIHWPTTTIQMLLPAYRACKSVAPKVPWVTIEPGCGRTYICKPGWNQKLAAFNPVSDELGSDQQPVSTRTVGDFHLHVVGQNTARMHKVGGKRRVWAVIQMCSAGSKHPGDPTLVMPTAAMLRFETADSILNGATAFSIYGADQRKCMTNPQDIADGFNWHGYRARMLPVMTFLKKMKPLLGRCGKKTRVGNVDTRTCGKVRLSVNTVKFTFKTKVVK